MVAQGQPKVGHRTQHISLEVENEVVGQVIRVRLLLDQFVLAVVSWFVDLLWLDVRDQFLVPCDEVDIAIEVTSRHHVALRSVTFARENNDVEEISQLMLVDTVQDPDVSRVSAWISCDQDISFNNLSLAVD